MARKEYDTFVLQEKDPEVMPDGEVAIAVRELTPDDRRRKYATRYVKAEISRDPANLPDVLRLRWQRGRLYPKPWSIRIIEELGEFMPKESIWA
jgi:hypothetical protein